MSLPLSFLANIYSSMTSSCPLGFLITMKKELLNTDQSFSLLFTLLFMVSFEAIVNRVGKIQKFLSSFCLCLQSQLSFLHSKVCEESKKQQHSDLCNRQCCVFDKKDDGKYFSREDLEMVMERLGIFCSSESEELKESMSSDEISMLFDEKEPSLEEVKEAFNVFDQNKDGFIDAQELQRVLRKLGLKEGFEQDNCSKMIRRFDENGDGRIDFNEFVKFMENNFC